MARQLLLQKMQVAGSGTWICLARTLPKFFQMGPFLPFRTPPTPCLVAVAGCEASSNGTCDMVYHDVALFLIPSPSRAAAGVEYANVTCCDAPLMHPPW